MTLPNDPLKIEEYLKRLRKKLRDPSGETWKKLSKSAKGRTPWNKGKKTGKPSWIKGKHHSEETRKKISEAQKGKHPTHSEETRKKISEANKGEKSSQWKGGISFEPYCIKFNKNFKERVRAFFDYICVECGTPENGEKHTVHHVNFNKMSCCDDSKPLFVPLCHSCHSKTNFNRPYWEEHFTKIINTYYGGKCYFTESEMEQRINI